MRDTIEFELSKKRVSFRIVDVHSGEILSVVDSYPEAEAQCWDSHDTRTVQIIKVFEPKPENREESNGETE